MIGVSHQVVDDGDLKSRSPLPGEILGLNILRVGLGRIQQTPRGRRYEPAGTCYP